VSDLVTQCCFFAPDSGTVIAAIFRVGLFRVRPTLISVVNHIYDQKYNGAGPEKLKRIFKRTPSDLGLPHLEVTACYNAKKAQPHDNPHTAAEKRECFG